MQKVQKLEQLIEKHIKHYGYYEPLDSQIEELLKDIVYDEDLLKTAMEEINEFSRVYRDHSPLPNNPNCQGNNKYFVRMDYWKSFTLCMSWYRYH